MRKTGIMGAHTFCIHMDSDTENTHTALSAVAGKTRIRKAKTDGTDVPKTRVTKTTRQKSAQSEEEAAAGASGVSPSTQTRKTSARKQKALLAPEESPAEQPKPRRGRKPKGQAEIQDAASVPPAPAETPEKKGRLSRKRPEPESAVKEGIVASPEKEERSSPFVQPETVGGAEDERTGGRRKHRRRNRRGGQGDPASQQSALANVSVKKLHRRAWQIFLGEVTEEGLALMDDATARETARRAYRVTEFYLLEAARHDKRAHQDEAPADHQAGDNI